MIDRLKLAKSVDEIIICTSSNEQDKPLGTLAKENKVKCYFGEPDDVLVRLLGAADKFKLDYILNITADCPFVDYEVCNQVLFLHESTNADYTSNTIPFTWPDGLDCEIIKFSA